MPWCTLYPKLNHLVLLISRTSALFFSLISKRLVNHTITNNLISTLVQKGCMGKVPGCWEHMSMVWSALKEVCSTRSSLGNIWLDIANAYGTIPHRLLFFASERYDLIPIGFPLSKCTIQEFIAVLFLSLLQVVGISRVGNFCWMHFVNNSFSGRDKCGN